MGIGDVNITDLIEKTAEKLRLNEKIKAPAWSIYVKTGTHKERPPLKSGWWHIRVAAILVSVNRLGPVGVQKLRIKYGGLKRRGHKPAEFRKGSGSIVRKSLQQLESAGLIKYAEVGVHKGRVITAEGKKLLNEVANMLSKETGVKVKIEKKVEELPKEPVKPASKPRVKKTAAPKIESQ